MAPSDDFIKLHLSDTLTEVELLFDAKRIHHGKVRDTFKIGNKRLLVTTDRQSAFDRVLASVPFKGQVLNKISEFWFNNTKDIVKNHMIAVPDGNVMVVKPAKVFPVEVIVRDFLTGSTDTSVWINYKNGVRDFCGIKLPDGLKKNHQFEKPILTPTTKSDEHDKSISAKEIIEDGLVEKEKWDKIADYAIKIFERGKQICKKGGLILVDTKFEFGEDENGEIMVVDEMLTPDSSRFWLAKDYKERIANGEEPRNIDKEFLRLWFVEHCDPYNDKILPKAPDELVIELAKRYIKAFEMITGEIFVPEIGEPTALARIEKNLKKYFDLEEHK